MNREQMIIEIDGRKVSVILDLKSHYAAIEIYEKLLAQARQGFLLLNVGGVNVETDGP